MTEAIRAAYNTAADTYRKKYDRILARTADVDVALAYLQKEDPFVVEIGCAYGREAAYILKKTSRYIGVDISDEYIKIAQKELPQGTFVRSDICAYEFPERIDVVFAFASLLHISKEELQQLLQRIHIKLNEGGIIFLSLKWKAEYGTEIETDDVVSRRFYYYNRATISALAGDLYTEVFYEEQSRDIPWFTMILQKK